MRSFPARRPSRTSPRRGSAATVTALLVCLTLAGCSHPQPLEVGSCITEPPADSQGQRLTAVSCDKQHYGEVIGTYAATDGPFPGVQALADESREACKAAFEEAVGVPAETSVYDLVPLTPSESSWNSANDRQVLCVARSSTGESLVGSVVGTHR